MGELVIQNVNVVLPDQVLENGSVRLQDQLIQEVSENPWLGPESPDGRILDGQGAFLLPGLIDIHSDNIETVIQPRPQSMIDFELAMREQEKQLVCQGITTMYHSLTIMDTHFGGERVAQKQQLRSPENLTKLIGLIRNFHEGDHLIRHRFHCRYEITNTRGYPIYDRFAHVSLNMITSKADPCTKVYARDLIKEFDSSKKIADVFEQYQNNYVCKLRRVFKDTYKTDRNIDRALWSYGHIFYCSK